ncbi:YD repeat protein [Anopheles sinensis]|uniref:YD repeat protein n=1 Tax=Anopheles sinensis TaxID=74873 RepID=A0A084VGN8_ANOSI|nr:YD repeat protein [Anopheles sinensis]
MVWFADSGGGGGHRRRRAGIEIIRFGVSGGGLGLVGGGRLHVCFSKSGNRGITKRVEGFTAFARASACGSPGKDVRARRGLPDAVGWAQSPKLLASAGNCAGVYRGTGVSADNRRMLTEAIAD